MIFTRYFCFACWGTSRREYYDERDVGRKGRNVDFNYTLKGVILTASNECVPTPGRRGTGDTLLLEMSLLLIWLFNGWEKEGRGQDESGISWRPLYRRFFARCVHFTFDYRYYLKITNILIVQRNEKRDIEQCGCCKTFSTVSKSVFLAGKKRERKKEKKKKMKTKG